LDRFFIFWGERACLASCANLSYQLYYFHVSGKGRHKDRKRLPAPGSRLPAPGSRLPAPGSYFTQKNSARLSNETVNPPLFYKNTSFRGKNTVKSLDFTPAPSGFNPRSLFPVHWFLDFTPFRGKYAAGGLRKSFCAKGKKDVIEFGGGVTNLRSKIVCYPLMR
jgi:hypothetical protein